MRELTWTAKEILIIKNNYSNYGSKYCADILNKTRQQVISKANRLGLKFNAENLYKLRMKKSENFAVKADLFINCQTPETAYLLGFIWGDGHVVNNNKKFKTEQKLIVNGIQEDIENILPLFELFGKWSLQYCF